jgi:hypothetical protein
MYVYVYVYMLFWMMITAVLALLMPAKHVVCINTLNVCICTYVHVILDDDDSCLSLLDAVQNMCGVHTLNVCICAHVHVCICTHVHVILDTVRVMMAAVLALLMPAKYVVCIYTLNVYICTHVHVILDTFRAMMAAVLAFLMPAIMPCVCIECLYMYICTCYSRHIHSDDGSCFGLVDGFKICGVYILDVCVYMHMLLWTHSQ